MRLSGAIEQLVGLPRPLLIALDVDGTLAPIAPDPAAARVPLATRVLLRRLIGTRGVRVALVTGRDATSLRRILPLPGAWRALEHGRRIVAPGEVAPRRGLASADRERLDAFATWARRVAVPRGARLEEKPGARAVHVRELASRDRRKAERVLVAARRQARHLGLHPREGRAVIEAEIEPGDKGTALLAIRRATRARSVLYAGDDVTDTPALRQAVALGGLGVFVRSAERPRGPRGTSLSLEGPEGVRRLLERFLARLEGR